MKTKEKIFLIVLMLIITITLSAQDSTKSKNSNRLNVKDQSEKTSNESKGILNDLLIPITKFLTLLSISAGIVISIRQYRLKVKEEIRMSKSAIAENDVKLLKLFAETIEIANGRNGHIISEKIIENLFSKNIITQSDFQDPDNLENVKKKLDVAIRVIPVGAASQHSAIASIGVLGKKYDVLKEPALKGLNNLIVQKIAYPTQEVLDTLNVPVPGKSRCDKIKEWW
ncbi:MAG: hypothetical protein WCG45_01240 [bacterium]